MTKITGIGFLLFAYVNNEPKILTIKELKSKPAIHKIEGMIGPPFETMEKGESPHQTVKRLLKEEIGISDDMVSICSIIPKRFNLIPGRSDIETIYGYGIFLGDTQREFKPDDDDIEFAGWKTTEELRKEFIRVETLPILKDFSAYGHYAKMIQQLRKLNCDKKK